MPTTKKTVKHNSTTIRRRRTKRALTKIRRAKANPPSHIGRFVIEALQDLDKHSGKTKMRNHKLQYLYWSGTSWVKDLSDAEEFGAQKFALHQANKLMPHISSTIIHVRVRRA